MLSARAAPDKTTAATPKMTAGRIFLIDMDAISSLPRLYPIGRAPSLALEFAAREQRVEDEARGEAADMRDPGDGLALAADAGDTGRRVHDEPQHDNEPEAAPEDREPQNAAEQPADRGRSADHLLGRARIDGELGEGAGDAAQQVEDEESPTPQPLLDAGAERQEPQHVDREMGDAAMEEL